MTDDEYAERVDAMYEEFIARATRLVIAGASPEAAAQAVFAAMRPRMEVLLHQYFAERAGHSATLQ